MAQKAAKATARKNTSTLTTLHLISLGINVFFLLYRFLLHYRSSSRRAVLLYAVLNTPALVIEYYLESIGRPKDARKSGEDLAASGLMEMLWDVVYVTWGCLVVVALVGEWGWWLWAVIPIYGAYAAYTMATGMRGTLAGLGGPANDMAAGAGGSGGAGSKRQAKMEKRAADGKGNVKYR